MADDEAESESSCKSAAVSSPLLSETTAAVSTASAESSPSDNNESIANAAELNDGSPGDGVRTIVIERSEYGFGFTLRHFIVYPPESTAILARDRRLGFRRPIAPNEPIDTIFVKNVRENGPAHVAGLATGDRIISVNGQDISGLSYLLVVNLIFRTKDCLRLAVVAQENDALQLYFGQVAHHPESNRKHRECLVADVSSSYDRDRTPSMISSNTRHYARCDSTPLYSSLQPSNSTSLTHQMTPVSSSRRLDDLGERRSGIGGVTAGTNCYGNDATPSPSPSSSSSAQLGLNCTYSADVDFDRNTCDSMSDSSVKDYLACDDSVVMNRLRKSLEQKQEFLNRLPCWTTTAATDQLPSPSTSQSASTKLKSPFGSASTSPSTRNNTGNAAVVTLPVASPTSPSSPSPPPPPFQVVSVRAKQFENGPPPDERTELFRSELARLSVMKNAVNVATRKRDLEYRVQLDKQTVPVRGSGTNAAKQATASRNGQATGAAVATARIDTRSSSGNQTIPVGSNKLHCEPPCEFQSVFQTKLQDDDKTTRRISYLKATTAHSVNMDSENELDDAAEPAPVTPQRRTTRKWRRAPLFPGDIQRLRRFFEDLAATGGERGVLGSRKIAEAFLPDQEDLPVVKEGNVFCKVIQVEGKKASDRSWKPIWLILKGNVLYLVKEKKESPFTETPATFEKSDLAASCDRLDIRCSAVEVANDYTKRKHVLRLNAPSVGTELLLQAQDANGMGEWVRVLREQAQAPAPTQAVVPVTSVEAMSTNFGTSVSPSACNKTLRKLASLRTRSPTGDVPSGKSKKLMPNDYQQTSPKTKTWKNKMAKQFRKIQPGANSPGSSAAAGTVTYPPGATIGVPLELCPSSTFSEYVPLIVQVCANIVEAKGLEIIGIYRVPGNTAAVTSLTEAVNRGLEMTALDQDPRWSDVNVISSLLKSFFRKLPDALLTSELYPNFIKSDAIEDPIQRMITIRKLVHDLPDHNFETLKYLLLHLKKVVANAAVNKMEARNLAIVFGPTLIRSGDDMFTMVTDMSHQCRIVESLLSHVDWCFGDGDVNELKTSIPENNTIPELEATSSNHTLLLGNIRKVEECMQSPTTAKDFVSTIIGAANRKMHKTSKHLIGGGSSSSGGGAGGGKKSTATVAAAAAVTAACTSYAIGSGSEDALDSIVTVAPPSIPVVTRNTENKVVTPVEPKTDNMDLIRNGNEDGSRSCNVESSASHQPTDTERDSNTANEDQVSWTYPKLSAETKERIRKFEEETEALLQRCTNPRRLSGCASITEEVEKEKSLSKNDRMVHDSPPPVVVTRRNLPNVCAKNIGPAIVQDGRKKSSRTGEFIRNNSREKSTSLESLNNRTSRPSSRHSDDGCDLLMTLTSTFDKKLKSLSNDTSLCEEADAGETVSKSQFISRVQVDRNRSFRDPSLHRNVDKWCKMDMTRGRTDANITDKENDQHDEEKEKKDVDEKEKPAQSQSRPLTASSVSCATCGCSVAHSEAVQQNCDNWKRSALQEIEIRSQQNRGDSRLFYSNSVKLRRSGSLKEEGASTKLRRSGSLNKYEPSTKVSKFECLMLTKNADAIKLRRGDSLTKSEKTETNLKRRQSAHAENDRKIRGGGGGGGDKEGKLKRRNGVNKCRNIKRRHTVGGTKDFDKVSWLHNQQRGPSPGDTDKENRRERRTSSPDLSATKAAAAGAPDFLVQVVVRPTSFIAATTTDPNFVSRLLNIPLESHV